MKLSVKRPHHHSAHGCSFHHHVWLASVCLVKQPIDFRPRSKCELGQTWLPGKNLRKIFNQYWKFLVCNKYKFLWCFNDTVSRTWVTNHFIAKVKRCFQMVRSVKSEVTFKVNEEYLVIWNASLIKFVLFHPHTKKWLALGITYLIRFSIWHVMQR